MWNPCLKLCADSGLRSRNGASLICAEILSNATQFLPQHRDLFNKVPHELVRLGVQRHNGLILFSNIAHEDVIGRRRLAGLGRSRHDSLDEQFVS